MTQRYASELSCIAVQLEVLYSEHFWQTKDNNRMYNKPRNNGWLVASQNEQINFSSDIYRFFGRSNYSAKVCHYQPRVWLAAHVGQGKCFLPSGWKAELLTENLPAVSENLLTISENLPAVSENLSTVSENLPTHVWQAATYSARQTCTCLSKPYIYP